MRRRSPPAWLTGSGAALLLLTLPAVPARSQAVVASPAPDRVAVTLYRNPDRPQGKGPNLQWLNGFALVSEVRRVQLPAGASEIRFEGVAGGIIPQSAIVTGLPSGALEKNRDAYLLSAGSLIEQQLGQRVTLRRTSPVTGAVREEEAIIRSGAANGLVVETEAGLEALRCTGLNETLVHDRVPQGLSARPTLSVRTRSAEPVEATVTLSYLATNFDWQANYVAELDEAERRIDLTAWLTLANGDPTSFVQANTQAVAGRLNYDRPPLAPSEAPPLNYRCWPQARTSDHPLWSSEAVDALDSEEIVVTGSRISKSALAAPPPPPPPAPMRGGMDAAQEDLGDLKLYRLPEPVTISARSLKQIRFLERRRVPVRFVYRAGHADEGIVTAARILLLNNRERGRLGVPLPAGQLVLLGRLSGERLLLGEGVTGDKAVGEEVEIPLGEMPGASVTSRRMKRGREVTVANDSPQPRTFEIDLAEGERGNARRDGRPIWRVTVPGKRSRNRRF